MLCLFSNNANKGYVMTPTNNQPSNEVVMMDKEEKPAEDSREDK